MCGITGFYSSTEAFSEEQLRMMTDVLKHRGPDAEGFFYDGICGLGHRRLSIIDLSVRGNQPMSSANDRYVIIYNGEVYNYAELGVGLTESSSFSGASDTKFHLKSASDTEVILELFSRYGAESVSRLNGMFAYAIYDKQEKELHLFRDRQGIKPLYYYWDGNKLAFTSELRSFRLLKKIKLQINPKAVFDFLHFGFVPAPASIYQNVFKLPAGSYLKLNSKGLTIERYWKLEDKIQEQITTNEDQAIVKLSDLLTSSVQYQLRSDVPFGVFLSGGVDSSLITALATMASSSRINTFSIGFEEISHNESIYAKEVATYLGTSHHEFIISFKDAIELVDSITHTYGEPFADSSSIPTMLVSRLARKHVTVCLSGEGGDELFFGYGAHQWARRFSNPLLMLSRKPLSSLLSFGDSRLKRIGSLLNYKNSENLFHHIFSQEQYFFASIELAPLLSPDWQKELFNTPSSAVSAGANWPLTTSDPMKKLDKRNLTFMEQQAIFDLQYYLQDDLLTKVDRASMRFSLETRVPYLDHRIVEFALNLSPGLKYKRGEPKYLLKQVLYQYLPQRIFDRPKQGFAIPLAKWLKNELRYLPDELLSETAINTTGIFNYIQVSDMVKRFFNGESYLFNRIWSIILLQKWLMNYHQD
ncbi:MAG TPA: asparagine synthase (glutamine-hydrolyzing) [Bacteroidia bacterium]|nr:asparagine synthase (glutamine-hydrolyzing) [Bacteroidia bacterium]